MRPAEPGGQPRRSQPPPEGPLYFGGLCSAIRSWYVRRQAASFRVPFVSILILQCDNNAFMGWSRWSYKYVTDIGVTSLISCFGTIDSLKLFCCCWLLEDCLEGPRHRGLRPPPPWAPSRLLHKSDSLHFHLSFFLWFINLLWTHRSTCASGVPVAHHLPRDDTVQVVIGLLNFPCCHINFERIQKRKKRENVSANSSSPRSDEILKWIR